MLKKNKLKVIVSSIAILLPMLFGLVSVAFCLRAIYTFR